MVRATTKYNVAVELLTLKGIYSHFKVTELVTK